MTVSGNRASILRRSLAGASLTILAFAATPAFAEDVPPVAPVAAQEEEPQAQQGQGEIVVTATRREEAINDVPVAVSVLGGENLDTLNSSGLDIRFLSSRTPSLQIESSFGRTFPRFYIRGLGNTDFDPNAAQPVSVVYDDVALENPMLKSFPVFDLNTVEVLRGPQGTLFGRNTPAGVVKLNSARPTDTLQGYFQASWATYNTVNAEGAVSGPLGGGFSARLSGLLQRRDDWVTNTSTSGFADDKLEGYRDLAGRLLIAYEAPGFNALFNIHGRDLDGTPRVFRGGAIAIGSDNQFNTGFDKDEVALDGYTSQSMRQWGTNLHLDVALGDFGTLYSITAYEEADVESTGDIDGSNCYAFLPGCTLGSINVGAFPVNTGGVTRPQEFSQELRIASNDMGGFTFQGGLYYFHQTLKYNEYSYVWPPSGSRTGDLEADIAHDNSYENWGIFLSGEFKATDALTLRAGARYSHDKKKDVITGFHPGLSQTLPASLEVDDGDLTWDLSATYAVTDDVNVYARVATGYLGPAIQDRVVFGSQQTAAEKQTTISGEAGIKGSVADRTIRFALDGYWFRTDDLQLTAVGGASNSARLINADHAIGYGFEAELDARPVPELILTGSVSYNFTELQDPNLRIAPCGAPCTMIDPVSGGLASIDGNDLPQAPRWVANWTVRYGVPLANGDEVFAFTDWAYRSEVNFFLYEAKEFTGRSLLEGGLRVGYRTANGMEFAAFARNITNQIRTVSAIDFNNLTGMINEPRVIGGSFRIGF